MKKKPDSSLTTGEQKKLSELEETIESGVKSFMAVGHALMAIRDRKLYTDVHETFEGYCKKRWDFTRQRAHQLIESTRAVETVSTIVDIAPPSNEAQARVLSEIEDENQQADVWTKAVESAPKGKDGKPKVTAAHVKKVRDGVFGDKKPEPAKAAPKEKEPLTDDEGQQVPKSLAEIFEKAAEFEQHARSLTAIQKWAEEVAKEDYAVWLHVQSLVGDLNNAKQALRFNKPYAVCPYCQAKNKKCEACKGHGFVSKGIYKAAPAEMRV